MSFRAPVRDLAFSLVEAAGVERLIGAFPDFDLETMEAVLTAAGQFAEEVGTSSTLLPTTGYFSSPSPTCSTTS